MSEDTLQRPVDLVIIGHLGFQDNRTPMGAELSVGGAVYNCAVGATIFFPERIGIVATIGSDLDISRVVKLGVNVEGVAVSLIGTSAQFLITQMENGSRQVTVDLGIAEQVNLASFPASYASAQYIHLATAPPSQQLQWLHMLRAFPVQSKISIDTLEMFARDYPKETREALEMADLIFMNEEEATLLGLIEKSQIRDKSSVLKKGAQGACYNDKTKSICFSAPSVKVVDTTGAGDVLAGAFLAMRAINMPPAIALKEAVEIATASVTGFGVNHKRLSTSIHQVATRWKVLSKAIYSNG